MGFTDGVKALVVFGRAKRFCYNPFQIYNFLIENGVAWEIAFDARTWAQAANIGETYNEKNFDIYIE